MFGSVLGTWLPFLSIFAATYVTGLWVVGNGGDPASEIKRRAG
jgi:hypothetical protein